MIKRDHDAPERGEARRAHFLTRARLHKYRSARAASEATRSVSPRTIQAYENAERDFGPTPPPSLVNYAQALAGWTIDDLIAIYEGGPMPPVRPNPGEAPHPDDVRPISPETQHAVLSAIYGMRDIPAWERKHIAALIAGWPVTEDDASSSAR